MKKSYKIYTHDQYHNYLNEITALPSRFDNEGVVLYHVRNCIKKIVVQGNAWNVKSFKQPHPINRIVYRHLRKSKAERSFINATRLLNLGINTPHPIAYIIEYNLLGIYKSFYISQHIDYDYTLGELITQCPDNKELIMNRCLQFINEFHRKGVYFLDLSVGNILIKQQPDGNTTFYLVDVNRTTFYNRPLTCSESIKAFCRLDTTHEEKEWILRRYAQISGYDFNQVMQYYHNHSHHDANRRRLKRLHLKNILNKNK